MTGRQTAEYIKAGLSEQIASVLNEPAGNLSLLVISRSEAADGTTVISVSDAKNNQRAVVLCSPPGFPDMVDRAMVMADKAKQALGPRLGDHVLDPLLRGRLEGDSYAVLPYCRPLSNSPVVSRVQNFKLRPTLFDWLYEALRKTLSPAPTSAIAERFEQRLRHLASMTAVNQDLRSAANDALERLQSGAWKPRHVLAHGDCWRGNVLIRPAAAFSERRPWASRFVLIDWPGADVDGYAMFDLVRMAQSMRLTSRQLLDELNRHCDALQCETRDASSYLLAGLGNLGMTLECFPVEQFARMAAACHSTLQLALG